MAIRGTDLMSTQTGGAGETIQAQPTQTSTPEQFSANINIPQQESQQPMGLPTQAPTPKPAPQEQMEVIEQPQVSEEQILQQKLGLNQIEEPTGLEPVSETDVIQSNTEYASPTELPDGLLVRDLSEPIKTEEEPLIKIEEEPEQVEQQVEVSNLPDGLSVYNPNEKIQLEAKELNKQYAGTGINVDDKGKIKKVKDGEEPKPDGIYKYPGSDYLIKKEGGKWYRDSNKDGKFELIKDGVKRLELIEKYAYQGEKEGKPDGTYVMPNNPSAVYKKQDNEWSVDFEGNGNYIPLTKGDVKARVENLEKNSQPLKSKTLDEVEKNIGSRLGTISDFNMNNALVNDGDPIVSNTNTFDKATKDYTKPGEKWERYNPDGTLNFNYDPEASKQKELGFATEAAYGRPDGEYRFPDNKNSYKKEKGKWYIKPAGADKFVPLTKGDVEARIAQLEKRAYKPIEAKETLAFVKSLDPNKGFSQIMEKSNQAIDLYSGKSEDYKKAFDDAKNFSNNDLERIYGNDLSEEQKAGLKQYQDDIKKIIGDGEYDISKGNSVSKIMKDARAFFDSSKEVNDKIIEAYQNNESLDRLSFENKRKTYKENLGTSGFETDTQRLTRETFEATSNMAQFILDNVDEGKIRYDRKNGGYIFAENLSGKERQFLEEKLNTYLTEYDNIQKEKYRQANEELINAKQTKNLVKENIDRLEKQLAFSLKEDSIERQIALEQLDKNKKIYEKLENKIDDLELSKKTVFLTEPNKIAIKIGSNLSEDAKDVFNSVPSNISPKQRFDLFYERLEAENNKLAKDNGIDAAGFSTLSMRLKDMLDWDGYYQLSNAEKRYLRNLATLKQLAPLYYNNDTGITKESAGFWDSFMNGLRQVLTPTASAADSHFSQASAAAKQLEVMESEGFTPDDFLDKNVLERLDRKATMNEWDTEKVSGMIGSTIGIIMPLIIARKIPVGALRSISALEKIITGNKNSKIIADLVTKSGSVYNRVLSSTKFGRFMAPAIKEGAKFELAGRIFGSVQEEINFLSGLAGGAASEAFGLMFSKLPVDQAVLYVSNLFGSKTKEAILVFAGIGKYLTQKPIARGLGSTSFLGAQDLANVYQNTENWQEMKKELEAEFGTFDKVQDFVISSFVMGVAFGLVDGGKAKETLEAMPEAKKKQTLDAMAAVASDLKKAESATSEFIDNKLKQQEVESRISEPTKEKIDDTKKEEKLAENREGGEVFPYKGDEYLIQKEKEGEISAFSIINNEYVPLETIPNENLKSFQNPLAVSKDVVENADITKPIIIGDTGDAYFVLDGNHRLTKAMMEGKDIQAYVLSPEQTKKIKLENGSPKIYDTKNKQGVSGKERKVEEPKQAEPVAEPGKETPSPSGVVQETGQEVAIGETPTELPKTTSEKAKSMADAVRGMKLKPGRGGTTAMSAVPGFEEAFDAAVEVVARAIEIGGEGVQNIQKAFNSGFQEIKKSDWYNGLDKKQKDQVYKDYIRGMEGKFPKQPVSRAQRAAGKEFAGRVEEATGLAPEEKTIKLTPTEAIRRRYRDLAEGGKLTKKALQEIKKEVRDYIDKNLPAEKYSKREINRITNAITNATETNIETILDRVDKLIEKKEGSVEAREARAAEAKRVQTARDIAKMVKNKKTLLTKISNKWKGKVTVEAQKEFKEFVDSGALDNLEGKTQQELDAIKEVLDAIVDTGKADFKRFKEARDEAIRKENAELLEGLVDGTNIGRKADQKIEPTTLNGKEEIEQFFEDNPNGAVIIDGQLYTKSTFGKMKSKSSNLDDLKNDLDDAVKRRNSLIDDVSERVRELLKSRTPLESDAEYNRLTNEVESVNNEIESLNNSIEAIESKTAPIKERIKSLKSQNSELSKQALKLRESLISKGIDPKSDAQYSSLTDVIDANNQSIADAKAELKSETGEYEAIDSSLDNAKGYKQRNMTLVKEANLPKNQKWAKRVLRKLNPINAINDLYSSLEVASAYSSKVRKYIKNNIADPIQEAYVNKLEETSKKIKDYNKGIADIFGSKSKALDRLAEVPEGLKVIYDRAAQQVITTNAHLVSYYNLARIEATETRKSGEERLKKDVDVDKVRKYIDSNPDLKKYADFLMDKYKEFGVDYAPVYESYTNMPMPENIYYPEYASGFEGDFIDLDRVMNNEGDFDAASAVSNNMKQRTSFSGDYNLRMDAHATMLDYIKSMEHARQFLPISKKVNQLFNRQNSPYLVDALGTDGFNELRDHMAVVLSNHNPTGINSKFSWAMNSVATLSVLGTLGFKPASIFKQYTSFMHFWTAGIRDGIYPHSVISATIPTTKGEKELWKRLVTSEYILDRIKGGSTDLEMKRIIEKSSKDIFEKASKVGMQVAMTPIIGGDAAAILFGPGGGTSFGIAVYRKKIAEGMTHQEAMDYAYKRFATESERTQQSTRQDVTSNIQRDPIFRMMGMYRTGQMSMSKKVINGVRVLQNASKIEKNEGVDARREAISDKEIIQARVDITYYTLFGSLMFAAVSNGVIKLLWDSGDYDDDDKKRMYYDIGMDQISADLQGYGAIGFLGDWALNTLRGDSWKNNIPSLKSINNIIQAIESLPEVPGRTWENAGEEKRTEFIKEGEFVNEQGVMNEWTPEQYNALLEEFNDRSLWGRMTDAEKQAAVKAIGLGNLRTTYNNIDKAIEGDKDWSNAIMNWEDDYFKIAREKNKRDKIFEFLFGEPYILPKGEPSEATPELIPEPGIFDEDLVPSTVQDESRKKTRQLRRYNRRYQK